MVTSLALNLRLQRAGHEGRRRAASLLRLPAKGDMPLTITGCWHNWSTGRRECYTTPAYRTRVKYNGVAVYDFVSSRPQGCLRRLLGGLLALCEGARDYATFSKEKLTRGLLHSTFFGVFAKPSLHFRAPSLLRS